MGIKTPTIVRKTAAISATYCGSLNAEGRKKRFFRGGSRARIANADGPITARIRNAQIRTVQPKLRFGLLSILLRAILDTVRTYQGCGTSWSTDLGNQETE